MVRMLLEGGGEKGETYETLSNVGNMERNAKRCRSLINKYTSINSLHITESEPSVNSTNNLDLLIATPRYHYYMTEYITEKNTSSVTHN